MPFLVFKILTLIVTIQHLSLKAEIGLFYPIPQGNQANF